MKFTRLLVSIILTTFIITSCKKSNIAKPTTSSSKLLVSEAIDYEGPDSTFTYLYYYDNSNRLIKIINNAVGGTIDTTLFSYDSNDNLTQYSTKYNYILNGQQTYFVKSTFSINYVNGQPATANVTSTDYPYNTSLVYGVNGGKVTSMHETSGAYPNDPQSITVAYDGNNIKQIVQGLDITHEYVYNTHKNAYCNVNMKWMLPMHDGLFNSVFINKNDRSKEIINGDTTTYTATYNSQDYPTQITNVNTGSYIKYQYIAAK